MNITSTILKDLRIKKNITLEQLATELNEKFNINLTRSMLSKWETGKAAPVYDHLKRLASYYEVTTDFLLGFDNQEFSDNIISAPNPESSPKRIRNSKKHYLLEAINKALDADEITTKDLLFIKDFIDFYKLRKHN